MSEKQGNESQSPEKRPPRRLDEQQEDELNKEDWDEINRILLKQQRFFRWHHRR